MNISKYFIGFGDDDSKSLDDAIKKATEEKDPEKKEEKKEEKKSEDKNEDPSAEELAEIEQAQNLLKILKDPEGRKALITALAEKEGITKDSSEKEKKQAVRNIRSIIKEGLGDEYEVLSDRLEKVLTNFADLFFEEKVKPYAEKLSQREQREIHNAASAAYDKVFGEFTNSKELENEVAELCKDHPPKPGTDPEKYFRRMLILAAEEKGVKLSKVSAKNETVKSFNNDRREANRKDASSRLASEGADDGTVERKAPKSLSLDEAIAEGAKKAAELLNKR